MEGRRVEGSVLGGRPPMVLAVDDDPEQSRALARTLERAGYGVTTAANGEEALAILGTLPCDLVLADLRMPLKNGLELLREVRRLHPRLPLVMLTAFGEWTTYLQAMEGGAAEYLTKPVRREELLAVIAKVFAAGSRSGPDAAEPVG